MTHVRPFGLRHVMLVRRLQNQGTLLDLEQALTHPRSAVWAALLGQGTLAEGPVCTYVLSAGQEAPPPEGFAQARLRPSGDEADVIFLAPALDRSQGAEDTWRALLAGMSASLAHHGVQRIFARLSDELDAARLFLDTGFMLYTQEDIFLLEQLPAEEAPRGLLEPAREEARWGIARLYAAVTPQAVRAAEGMGNAAFAGTCGVGSGARTFVWSKGAEIAACVRLVSGPQGHWMHALIHPDEAARAEEILRDALSRLPREGARRVVCSVRAYQVHLRGPLQEIGFQFLTSQAVLVRQNAIPVKAAERRRAPALEKRAEAHTPTAARRDA